METVFGPIGVVTCFVGVMAIVAGTIHLVCKIIDTANMVAALGTDVDALGADRIRITTLEARVDGIINGPVARAKAKRR
jgi:hypothetical protein